MTEKAITMLELYEDFLEKSVARWNQSIPQYKDSSLQETVKALGQILESECIIIKVILEELKPRNHKRIN